MINMIPPRLDDTVKSNAERKVFNLIKNSSLSGYCFHSVGLATHEYKSYAEADFIVVTEYGILCIEVKGGQVSCTNGIWSFTNRFGVTNTKNEGPFQQAVGAMYSVKATLARYGNLSLACGVIFPDIEFKSNNLSVIPEIQMNCNYGGSFDDYLKICHLYWNNKFKKTSMTLNQNAIEAIRNEIREDLNFVPLLSLYAENTEMELVRLTNEQVDILESAKTNPRILVSGPAGSGKTLIAMEYAKLKSKEGNRILFLTYNKFLASFLEANNSDVNIKISSFHSLISVYIPIDQNNTTQQYYDKFLPNQFHKYLLNHKIAAYDILVIDEGQDLLKEDFVPCFDKLVKGTMIYGKWAIFYDSNQSIFNNNFDGNLRQIKKQSPTELMLSKNCRNVIPIAKFNNCLTKINTGKAVVEGEKIRLVSYENNSDCIAKINTEMRFLLDQGISKRDVIIISPLQFQNSIVNSNMINFPIKVFDVDSDEIRFSTIQSFKGLESKVIMFVDYETAIAQNNSNLIYTSLSRAKTLLYMFVNKSTESIIQSKVIDNISNN